MNSSESAGVQPFARGTQRDRPGRYLALALWCGLIAAAARLLIFAVRKEHLGLVFTPIDAVWIEPAAAVLALLVPAMVFAIASRVRPSRFYWPVLLGIEFALCILSPLLLLPRLHWAASIVLATGAGIQGARWAQAHQQTFMRLLRISLIPAIGMAILAVVLVPGGRRWREGREIGRLGPSAAGAPNVLLIILDTVRAWDLGLYGYPRPTSPELSRLAPRGVLFERAVSPAPWTLPSHASMFTGRWPHELSADWQRPLDDEFPTLAEALSARGYVTGGFVGNVRYCSPETGLARGFAHYVGYDVSVARILRTGLIGHVRQVGKWLLGQSLDTEEKERDAESIRELFVSWLDGRDAQAAQRPFFAFLNFYDAHRPYTSPAQFQARFSTPGIPFLSDLQPRHERGQPWTASEMQGSRDAYDAAIAYIDAELGRLFDDLDRRGVLSNTIVVVTADHGEEFGEHGVIGHGNSLYRPSVMVPLVIVGPRVPSDRRITTPVSTREIGRTVLDLIGAGADTTFPGRSLAGLWREGGDSAGTVATSGGTTPGGERMRPSHGSPVVSELNYAANVQEWYPVSSGPIHAIIEGPWRYVFRRDGDAELFDFDHDSLEQRNLAATDSGRVVAARLHALLDSLTGFAAVR
jgi:arylsulfatase A-like enzyme